MLHMFMEADVKANFVIANEIAKNSKPFICLVVFTLSNLPLQSKFLMLYHDKINCPDMV